MPNPIDINKTINISNPGDRRVVVLAVVKDGEVVELVEGLVTVVGCVVVLMG